MNTEEIARQYRIALAHYGGDKVKARAALEWWLRGIHQGEALKK